MGKNKNPYKNGNYHAIFAKMQELKIFTKEALIAFCMENLTSPEKARIRDENGEMIDNPLAGQITPMSEKQAAATVGVMLSPRLVGEDYDEANDGNAHGRGNFSAQGHVYYVALLKRKMVKVDGQDEKVKEPQRYQLRWRKEIMPPWTREYAYLTLAEQVEKEAEKAEAKAAAAAKKAEAEAKREENRKKREAAKKKREADAKKKANAKKKATAKKAKPKTAKKATSKRKPKKTAAKPKATRKRKPKAKAEPAEAPAVEIEAQTDDLTQDTPMPEAPETATEDNGEICEA